jgi:hypothetical protein
MGDPLVLKNQNTLLMKNLITAMLVLHIGGGTVALLSGLVAMFTTKGSFIHRLAGRIYFWGMTAVFTGALVVSIAHQNYFLLMVGFFSYYMTVRGYRILSLKSLHQGQKVAWLDHIILLLAGLFIISMLVFGCILLFDGHAMGVVAITFGLIGCGFLWLDVRRFWNPPTDRMHWWYGHINSMGGSYISAVTAFIVVNIQLPQFQWVLWVLPSLVGGLIIGRTIRRYRAKFSAIRVP